MAADDDDPDDITPPRPASTDDDDDDAGDESADDRRTAPAARGGGSASLGDGAGWVLGLLLWAGVALPFLNGGPAGVKAWWMAKFLNKAPDGSWLP